MEIVCNFNRRLKCKKKQQIENRYYRTIISTLNALLYASFTILIVSNDEHAHIVHTEHQRDKGREREKIHTSDRCVYFSRAHRIPTVLFGNV